MNGVYFIPCTYGTTNPYYSKAQSFPMADGSTIPSLSVDAGPLHCTAYKC